MEQSGLSASHSVVCIFGIARIHPRFYPKKTTSKRSAPATGPARAPGQPCHPVFGRGARHEHDTSAAHLLAATTSIHHHQRLWHTTAPAPRAPRREVAAQNGSAISATTIVPARHRHHIAPQRKWLNPKFWRPQDRACRCAHLTEQPTTASSSIESLVGRACLLDLPVPLPQLQPSPVHHLW